MIRAEGAALWGMKMNSGIYAIVNKKSRKVYIGSTNNFERRWKDHRKGAVKGTHWNRHFQSAWNKYGEDAFEFGVLEYLDNLEELFLAEQFWMDIYREEGKELYNQGKYADNPMRGVPMSEEHKRNIGDANRGRKLPPISEETRQKKRKSSMGQRHQRHTEETKRKMSKTRRGKRHSEETKRRIREAATGRPVSKETRQKISEGIKTYWAKRRSNSKD